MCSKLKLRIIIVVPLLVFCLLTRGQTVTIVPTLSKGSSGYDPVAANGKKYGLPGATLKYSITVSDIPNGVTVSEFSYKLNDEEDKDGEIKDGILQDIEVEESYTNNPGTIQLTVNVKFSSGNTISETDKSVVICSNSWRVDKSDNWTSDNTQKKVVWDTQDIELAFSNEVKDANCSINYNWTKGTTSLGTKNKWNGKLTTKSLKEDNIIIICKVNLIAPDGKTKWGEKEYKQTFTVYKSLTSDDIKLDAFEGASSFQKLYLIQKIKLPDERYLNLSFKDPFNSFNSTTTGLEIQWKQNDNSLDESSFRLVPEPYSGNISGSSNTDEYSVSLSYQPDNSLDKISLSKKIDVVTYKEPHFELSNSTYNLVIEKNSTLGIWNDESISVTNTTEGGYNEGWSYVWSENGANISNKKDLDAKKYSVDNTAYNKEYKISLVIQNTDPNKQLMYKSQFDFTFESWKKPSIKEETLVNRHIGTKTDNANKAYIYKQYDEGIYGERYFEIPDLGLRGDYWSYKWEYDNNNIDGKKFDSLNRLNDDYSIKVTATYRPANLIEQLSSYSVSKNLSVDYYSDPSVAIEKWRNAGSFQNKPIAVWDTTLNSVEVKTEGGTSDKWDFKWLVDGSAIEKTKLSESDHVWKDVLKLKGKDEVCSDYLISLNVSNCDPEGNLWFEQDCNAKYQVYKNLHPYILDAVIKEYQGTDKTIVMAYQGEKYGKNVVVVDSTALINDSRYIWKNEWQFGDYKPNDYGLTSKPQSNKNIGFHDRDTLISHVILNCKPENMDESIAFKERLDFVTILWPTPGFVVINLNNIQISDDGRYWYNDGDILMNTIEVSDCIEGDTLWHFEWRDNYDHILSNDSVLKKKFENSSEGFGDTTYIVHVYNELQDYGKDKFESSADYPVTVRPPFNVNNNNIVITPNTEDSRYIYETYKNDDDKTLYSMKGCGDIRFPIEYSPNKTLLLNDNSKKWKIFINDNEIPDDKYSISDEVLIVDKSVYSEAKDYSMVISGFLKDGNGDSKPFTFSQSYAIKIYEKPEISHQWDSTIVYAVWDNTRVKSEVKKQTESTDKWEFGWLRTSDLGARLGDSLILSNNMDIGDSSQSEMDILRFVATCYAPDGVTPWYKDTVDRKFRIWKHPELITRHYHDLGKMSTDWFVSNSRKDTSVINVNSKYCGSGAIEMGIDTTQVDERIVWNYKWEKDNILFLNTTSSNARRQFRYTECKLGTDTITVSLTAKANIPKIADDLVLGEQIVFSQQFHTVVWPEITILDGTQYLHNENIDSLLVVQAPNVIPKPVLSNSIEWNDNMPFQQPKYEWTRKGDTDNIAWSTDIKSNNKSNMYGDTTYTVHCEIIGEDGLDWCDGSMDYIVRVYPEMAVRNYVKELLDENGKKDYTALIVRDSINLFTDHNYIFGNWSYKDTVSYKRQNEYYVEVDTILKKNDVEAINHVLCYKIDSNDTWTAGVMADGNSSLLIKRHINCVSEEGFKLKLNNDVFEKQVVLWPYDVISTPESFQYVWKNGTSPVADTLKFSTIINQSQEKELTLYTVHSYAGSDNRIYWKYNWYDNGSGDNLVSHNSICNPELNKLNKCFIPKYRVEATYEPEGASPRHYKRYFYWVEYPAPEKFSIRSDRPTGDNKVREGDSCTYSLSGNLNSGNPDGWSFEWVEVRHSVYEINSNGTKKQIINKNSRYVITDLDSLSKNYTYKLRSADGDKRLYETFSCKVIIKNVNPANSKDVWIEDSLTFNDYVVYRRPKEPESLVKKGGVNGISNVYIATRPKGKTELNDNEVDDYYNGKKNSDSYEFVFGDDGGTVVRDDSDVRKRYCYYGKDGAQGVPWVKTLWHYPDDFDCYSDAVFYNNSGNVVTKGSIGELFIELPYFSAEFETPVTATVTIIDSNGMQVKRTNYGSSTMFGEELDFSDLNSGIYVIRFEIGEIRETRKIVIR